MPFRSLLAIASSDEFTIAASRSASRSSAFWSVMSRMMREVPIRWPSGSTTVESDTEIGTRRPSFVKPTVSK